jgi:hypothetical protein
LREKGRESVSGDLCQPVQGTFSGLGCRYQPLGDEAAHFMAAAMLCLYADSVEHIFQARLKTRTHFAHGALLLQIDCVFQTSA